MLLYTIHKTLVELWYTCFDGNCFFRPAATNRTAARPVSLQTQSVIPARPCPS